jgi:2-octaprenyl-6-methoxyphenol hydroxylase
LFALNTGSCQFLQGLGLWPQLAAYASPIHQVHVSHQGHFGAVRLNREDVELPSLGHVIPASYIEAALNEELLTLTNFKLYRPATLLSLSQANQIVTLVLATEEGEITMQAPIVIGADGTDSTVRSQVMIDAEEFDYQQSAIVTRTRLTRSHQHAAYERFLADGAIAMLPLTNDECATIWTADNETIAALSDLSDQAFLQQLQAAFGYRLGRLDKISQRYRFPLRMMRAKKYVDRGVFLLGNSAHTLHPIAAQGFNLALFEVGALVSGIMHKLKNQTTLSVSDLEAISQEIQQQQSMSIHLSHGLTQLFSHRSGLVNIFLQLGMVGLDLATPIKKRFIKKMTYIDGLQS